MAPRPSTLLLLAVLEISLAGCSGPRGQSRALTDRGSAGFARGDYDGALDDFARALALDPENDRARENVALVYKEQQRWGEAARAFGELAARRPGDAWLAREAAFARDALKNSDDERAAEARANAERAAIAAAADKRADSQLLRVFSTMSSESGVGEFGLESIRGGQIGEGTIGLGSLGGGSLGALSGDQGFGEIARALERVAFQLFDDEPGPTADEITRATLSGDLIVLAVENPAGPLAGELIRRILRRHLSEAAFCFARAAAQGDASTRHVRLRLTIGKSGAITQAEPSRARPGLVESCLARAARRWEFPTAAADTVAQARFLQL